MNRFLRSSLVIVCLAPLSAPVALAQDAPAAAHAPQPPRGPRPKPTNIKALPANISGDDVMKLMHGFEGDLGVECEFCHAKNPETRRNDFPSDANPVKETARAMIRMTNDLNTKFLAQLSDRKTTYPITCGTCHQGMAHPAVFVPKPHNHNHSDQAPVAEAAPAPSAH